MRALRAGVIAIPLVIVAAIVGAFLTFGLSANRDHRDSPTASQAFMSREVAGGRLTVAVEDGQARAFEIIARFESDDGSDDATLIQPGVSMTMVGHDMGRTPVPVFRRSDGTWKGTGSFPMSGRWRFQIVFDGEAVELDHTAR